MKLKIGKSGYVLLPPDILEAVGLSHSVGGTVEFQLHDGSVALGKSLAPPVCSNKDCGKPLTDRAICQVASDCTRRRIIGMRTWRRRRGSPLGRRARVRTCP